MASFTLRDDEEVVAAGAQETDDQGNTVGGVVGVATLVASDPAVLAVTVNADGSALIATTGALGTGVTLDGTDVNGLPLVQTSIDVVVSAPVGAGLALGTPTLR